MTASVTGCSTWMPGVHLEEENAPSSSTQELGRAGADVADRRGQPQRGRAERPRAARRRRAGAGASSSTFWWRRCTEQSRSPRWMPRAVARRAASWISTWRGALDVALEAARVVAERRQRLAPGGLDAAVELAAVAHHPHAAPAAARRRLDQQREAERRPGRRRPATHAGRRARHGQAAGLVLVAPARAAPSGGGPTNDDAGGGAGLGQRRRPRPGSRSRGAAPRRRPRAPPPPAPAASR